MSCHSSRWIAPMILAAAFAAQAQIVVKPVLWTPGNPSDPHTVINAMQATLGATVVLPASDDSFTYSWSFGDGSPATAAIAVSNVYNLSATHTYNASPGTTYTAVLTVTDTTTSATSTGNYPVIVQANTLTSRVNVAIDNGLWYLHLQMWRANTTNANDQTIAWGGWDTFGGSCPSVDDPTFGILANGHACLSIAGIDANNTQAFEVSGHLENGPSADPYTDDVARGLARVMFFLVPRAVNADGPKTIGYNPAVQASRCSDGSVPNFETIPPSCTGPATLILYNQGATSCTEPPCTITFDGNGNGQMLIEGNEEEDGFGIDPGYQSGMLLTAIVASGNAMGVARTGTAATEALPGVLGQTYQTLVQDLADGIGYCQYFGSSNSFDGSGNGGAWEYYCAANVSDANYYDDNSVSQWNAIGLIAAARGFGIAIPPIVTDTNQVWAAWDQNVTPPACSGVEPATCVAGQYGYDAWDDPLWGPWAVTPSGMVQMAMDGVGRTGANVPDQRWNMAESNYHDYFCNAAVNSSNTTNAMHSPRFYTYGMFSFTKSMEQHDPGGVLTPITFLLDVPSGTNPIDWYGALSAANGGTSPCDGVAQTLVSRQNPEGSWFGVDYTFDQYFFETAWSVQMLQKTSFTACVNNLSGTGQAGPEVSLTWTGIQGASSYSILRSTMNGESFSQIANTENTSYLDSTGLAGGDTYFYEVQPLNSNGGQICTSNQATVAVPAGEVNGGGLTLTGGDGGIVALGQSVSVAMAASGGTPPYSWKLLSAPAGIGISGNGIVSGTPTQAGPGSALVQVTDSSGPPAASASANATFSVFGFTSTVLPQGIAFSPYTTSVTATGGHLPYTYSFSFLPPGLSGSSSGTISGAVSAPGSWSITINARDSVGLTVSATAMLTFTAPGPLSVSGIVPPVPGIVNIVYSAVLSASGGAPPYTWSLTSGALPNGLALASGGTISGLPSSTGTFNFGVEATDVTGATAIGTASIAIAPVPLTIITPPPLATGVAAFPYPSQTLTATGGVPCVSPPAYTFSLAPGASLPGGLTLSPNGTLAGTTSSTGTFPFTVSVTDCSALAAAAVPARPAVSTAGRQRSSPRSPSRAAAALPRAVTANAGLSLTIQAASSNDILLNAGSVAFSLASPSAALPPAQNVGVVSTGPNPLSFSASISPSTPAPWLNVVASGTTPGGVTISLVNSPTYSALSLPAQSTPYQATVLVTCPSAAPCGDSPQTINVSLTVTATAPQLSVPTNLISFTTPASAPVPQSQNLTVQNTGGGSLGLGGISCESSWCTVTGFPGSVMGGSSASLTVTADPTGLAAGFYRTAVDLKTSAGSASIPVTLFIATAAGMTLQPGGTLFQSIGGGAPSGGYTSFLVDVVGSTPVNWTAKVVQGGSWLSVTGPASGPASGTQPGTVNLAINPTAVALLSPGPYYGVIEVDATGVVNTPLDFEVVLNVAPANASQVPAPSPTGLLFISAAGTEPPAQTVQVANNATTSATYSVAASTTPPGGTWLSVTGLPAPVAAGAAGQVKVSANPSNLNAGVYYGSVTFSTGGTSGESTVNVTLIVPLASQAVQQDRPQDQVSSATPAATCTATQIVPAQMGLVNNFSTPAGWPTPLAIALLDNCGNFVTNGQVVASFTNGDPVLPLTLANPASGLYSATWTPQRTGGQVTVNARASVPGFAPVTAQLVGAVAPNTAPVLTPNGTLNVYNPLPAAALAPGTLVQISGTALAASSMSAPSTPLPTSLNGTQVLVGGLPAPLQSVAPGLITAELPYELTPAMQYQVVVSANGALTTPSTIQLSGTDPGVATAMSGLLTASHVNGKPVSATSPAAPGEIIVLTAVGLGLTDTPVADGAPGPSSPLANALDKPSITINNEMATILFAGLQPGAVGVYQINAQVPADAPAGNLTLVLSQDGNPANSAILPVN